MAGNTDQVIKMKEKQKGEQIPFIKQLWSHAIIIESPKKKTKKTQPNSSTIIREMLKNKNVTEHKRSEDHQNRVPNSNFTSNQTSHKTNKQTSQDCTMV